MQIEAHENKDEDGIYIHINENGFSPSKLNISIGTKVIFENVGLEKHWPAGDDHPSHTLYDGTNLKTHCDVSSVLKSFDSCSGIDEGDTWSFVFEKEGEFSFHDHLWPQFTGEIIVNTESTDNVHKKVGLFKRIKNFTNNIFYKFWSYFKKNKRVIIPSNDVLNVEEYEKLKVNFEKIVKDVDPKKAIEELENLSEKDERVLNQCHDFLHIIGHAGFLKYKSFSVAVNYQKDFCNSGYIHGLFEAYFKNTENLELNLSKECSDYATDKREFDLWQCNHGIGHGVMYMTGGDIDKSLEFCNKNLPSKGEVISCQNGVYMELWNSEILAKEKDFINPANPFNTCKVRNIGKGDCYLYLPTYFSQTLKIDFVDILKECKNVELGYEMECLRGVGTEAMKKNISNPEIVFDMCSQAGRYNKQEACVMGAVGMYINQKGTINSGWNLCEIIEDKFKDSCLKEVKLREYLF